MPERFALVCVAHQNYIRRHSQPVRNGMFLLFTLIFSYFKRAGVHGPLLTATKFVGLRTKANPKPANFARRANTMIRFAFFYRAIKRGADNAWLPISSAYA